MIASALRFFCLHWISLSGSRHTINRFDARVAAARRSDWVIVSLRPKHSCYHRRLLGSCRSNCACHEVQLNGARHAAAAGLLLF